MCDTCKSAVCRYFYLFSHSRLLKHADTSLPPSLPSSRSPRPPSFCFLHPFIRKYVRWYLSFETRSWYGLISCHCSVSTLVYRISFIVLAARSSLSPPYRPNTSNPIFIRTRRTLFIVYYVYLSGSHARRQYFSGARENSILLRMAFLFLGPIFASSAQFLPAREQSLIFIF